MKANKHQPDTYESALERIERMIECMEPGSYIQIGDITDRISPEFRYGDIRQATYMLLKKYGIHIRRNADG